MEGKENVESDIGETTNSLEDPHKDINLSVSDLTEDITADHQSREQSSSVVDIHQFSEDNNDKLDEHGGDMNVNSASGSVEASSCVSPEVSAEKNTLTHESETPEGCMDITEPYTNEQPSTDHTQDVVDCIKGTLIQSPTLLAGTEFIKDNYLRGCKWSVDGSKLLTTANDNKFYVYDFAQELCTQDRFSEMKYSKVIHETGTVYDFCWYNQTSDPRSCCFLATSKDSPIHLWDGNSGELVSSYRAYDQMDELTTAHSLCYSWDGSKIYCGFRKMIRVFDTNRPGRECENRPTYVGKVGGQNGIISCLVSSAHGGLYAAGSYSRSIGLYYEPKGETVCVFEGQQGGVTHLAFSPDGTKLFSGGRKDPEILCWDLRNPGQILFVAVRKVETNQRIYFDLDSSGRYLISGNHDGTVTLWDTQQPPTQSRPDTDFVLESCQEFKAHNDTVNGISFHPSQPVLATSSGQRHSLLLDEESFFTNVSSEENALKLWLYK